MWLNSLTPNQRRALLGLAHNVIVSDGLLDPNEELMMDAFKREMDLAEIEPEYTDLAGIENVFDTRRTRTIALLNLLHLSYADGALEVEEECLLREVATAFGVDDDRFMLMCNWVRRLKALEAEALAFM